MIAIMGILSAIAVPKLGNILDDVRAKAASERLIEDITFIRSRAISHHDTTWLVVDQLQNQYGIYVGPDAGSRTLIPDPQTGDAFVLDLDSAYTSVAITSVNFGGSSEVSFDWKGTPSSGGTILLNSSRTLTLVAETGLIYETP